MECSHDGLTHQLPQIKDTEECSTWELLKKNYRYEKGNVLATKEPVRVPHIKLKADEGVGPDISNSLQT